MKKLSLDPRGVVSLAVRTDYDQVRLKGKGFIYLAADSGLLRPNSTDMMEHPWAEGSGAFIYKTLVHELGHVFGLQHQHNAGVMPGSLGDGGVRIYTKAFDCFWLKHCSEKYYLSANISKTLGDSTFLIDSISC